MKKLIVSLLMFSVSFLAAQDGAFKKMEKFDYVATNKHIPVISVTFVDGDGEEIHYKNPRKFKKFFEDLGQKVPLQKGDDLYRMYLRTQKYINLYDLPYKCQYLEFTRYKYKRK
jgi:hypothetical protein